MQNPEGSLSLGNKGKRFTAKLAGDRKIHRYQLLATSRRLAPSRALRYCSFACEEFVTVSIGASSVARIRGINRCSSVWACPVCAPTIRAERAREIQAAVEAAYEQGYDVAFVTATGPHSKGEPLSRLLGASAQFGRAVGTGRPWVRFARAAGYVGQIRAVEITHGANGWHPHVHSLLFFERKFGRTYREPVYLANGRPKIDDFGNCVLRTTDTFRELERLVFANWSRFLERDGAGYGRLHPQHGVKIVQAKKVSALNDALAKYVAGIDNGWGLGNEIARTDLKASGTTPFDLLASVHVDADAEAAALWLEFVKASHGKRAIVWSAGLKGLFDVEDKEDSELAADGTEEESVIEFRFPAGTWNILVRAGDVGFVLRQLELFSVSDEFAGGSRDIPLLYDSSGQCLTVVNVKLGDV